MHVHFCHADYLIVIGGEMQLGLCDIRPDSADFGAREIISLSGDKLSWVHIRPGILHGFYTPRSSTIVWGLSHGWDMDDEFGCQWNDPDLALNWPVIDDPLVSGRDAGYGSYSQLLRQYKELYASEK
jgi:dTDP-4-dehydrorhamnose 3,5-epimerase